MKIKFYTGTQAAVFLGVCHTTFKKMRRENTVKPYQSGKYLTLYDEAHLQQVKAEREAKEKK